MFRHVYLPGSQVHVKINFLEKVFAGTWNIMQLKFSGLSGGTALKTHTSEVNRIYILLIQRASVKYFFNMESTTDWYFELGLKMNPITLYCYLVLLKTQQQNIKIIRIIQLEGHNSILMWHTKSITGPISEKVLSFVCVEKDNVFHRHWWICRYLHQVINISTNPRSYQHQLVASYTSWLLQAFFTR